jgi:hypothetical protein
MNREKRFENVSWTYESDYEICNLFIDSRRRILKPLKRKLTHFVSLKMIPNYRLSLQNKLLHPRILISFTGLPPVFMF